MVGCFPWIRSSSKSPPNSLPRAKQLNEVSVTPTSKDYALEGTSEAIKILQSAVSIVGIVPAAQPVLKLALALITTCQGLTEIGEKIIELRKHIESVMLVMVAGITGRGGAKIPENIINDVERLGSDLQSIKRDLDEIAAQSRILVALFRTTNRAKVDRCSELLKNSLVHWEVARDISQGVILHDIQQGILKMRDELQIVQKSVGFFNQQAHTAKHASSRQMPPKPPNFCGRDKFVEDIVKILVSASTDQRQPRICIRGPGGMGKTSAAIAVMGHRNILRKFSQNNRFWVPCVSATSPDILLHILYSNLRISRDTGDYLADIMAELQSSMSLRLMLLDNFETPWNPSDGTRDEVENILHQLAALPQLSILMTMRTNVPPSGQIHWVDMPLGVVSPETSAAIYCSIHPRAKGKPKLAELLEALGHMPFAVTIVATLGNESKSMPESLLKDWRKQGPGILSSDHSVEDSISRSINLSINNKSIAKNASARTLLAILSLLPAGTTHRNLDWWAPKLSDTKAASISALSTVALVVDTERGDDEVSISVLPVVQSFMQQCNRISPAVREAICDACHSIVLGHKSSPGDASFKDDLMFLSSEEVNIQFILLEAAHNASTTTYIKKSLEVLIAFSWYQHWTRPRIEVIQHALRIARTTQMEDSIAECLFCLGSTLFRLDQYQNATLPLKEARDRFRKLSNVVRASECAFELVDAYLFLNDQTRAEAALSSVTESDMRSNGYVRARGKLARGMCLNDGLRHSMALRNLAIAKESFETKEINKPVYAAYCLHEIARVFGSMRRFPEALKAADQSLVIYEKFGPENRLVETLIVKGYLLLATNASLEQVLPTLERTLRGGQALGRPLAIAEAVELLGELHARERNVSSAIECYRAAQAEFESLSQHDEVARCRENLGQLAAMEKNSEMKWNGVLLSKLLLGLQVVE